MTLLYTPAMNREQNNLMLWSASPQTSNSGPVHKFYGHMDAVQGGFQLLDLIITELKSHMTSYNAMPLIG